MTISPVIKSKARAILESALASSVYISGPMSNIPEYNAPLFMAADEELMELGHSRFNPAAGLYECWAIAMEQDLSQLCGCSVMLLLPNWQTSQGARIEVFVARRLEKVIIDADVGLIGWDQIDKINISDIEQLVVNQAIKLGLVQQTLTTGLWK